MSDPRTFTLTSPHTHGPDVKSLQQLLNQRFSDWEVHHSIETDGDYGPATRDALKTIAHGMGIAQKPIDDHGCTPHVRDLIRHPAHRNKIQVGRAKDRAEWRRALRKRYDQKGVDAAVAFARAMAAKHIVEHPAGSNRGPYIDDWNRAVGTPPGPQAYWCVAAANRILVAGGFPNQSFLAYCPAIEAHARAGIGGWKWKPASSTPQSGWLALFTEGGVAGHVAFVLDGSPFTTAEGNTSPDAGTGSQSNGGGFFIRHRNPKAAGFPVRGYAVPPWH